MHPVKFPSRWGGGGLCWPAGLLLTLIDCEANDKFNFHTLSRKALAGLFSYLHTHPSGGVDVPFGGHIL